MYTSGPKKVSIFPPGFNPAAPGGGPKTWAGNGQPKVPMQVATNPPINGPPINQTTANPNQLKVLPTNQPPSGAPNQQPVFNKPNNLPYPVPQNNYQQNGQASSNQPNTSANGHIDDDEPPPPPEWIEESELAENTVLPNSSVPPNNFDSTNALPKVLVGGKRPASSEISQPVFPSQPPPAVPKARPQSMHFGNSSPVNGLGGKVPLMNGNGGMPNLGVLPNLNGPAPSVGTMPSLPKFAMPAPLKAPSALPPPMNVTPKVPQAMPKLNVVSLSVPSAAPPPVLLPVSAAPPATISAPPPATILSQAPLTSTFASPLASTYGSSKPKKHPLLPVPVPDRPTSRPVAPPTTSFPIRFLVSKGETKTLMCDPSSRVIELLTDSMFELLEHVDDDDFITFHLYCGNETEIIDNSAVVGESLYVQECLARDMAPSVMLLKSSTATDLDDLDDFASSPVNIDNPLADSGTLQPSNTTQTPMQPVTPTPDGFSPGPPTSTSPTPNAPNGSSTLPPNAVPAIPPVNKPSAVGTDPAPPPSQTPLAIPPPAQFAPPSNAPKVTQPIPQYAPPSRLPTATPSTLNVSLGAGASTPPKSPPSKSPTRARPSVTSFTGHRKSIFETRAHLVHRSPHRGGGPGAEMPFQARFALPGGQVITLEIGTRDSIASIKGKLSQLVKDQLGLDLSTDKYLLKLPGASFVTTENQIMKSLPYVHNCLMRGSQPMFTVLDKTSEASKRIKTNNKNIGALIARPLSWVQQDDEITSFRQSMTRLRYFQRQAQSKTSISDKNQIPGLPIHVGATVPPRDPNNQTLISLTLELLQVKKKLAVKAEETAEQFIQSHVDKLYIKQGKTTKPASNFILKPQGLAEYIYGPYPLHSFDYFRECIAKNKPIELMLVDLNDVPRKSPSSANLQAEQNNIAQSASLEDETFLLDDPTVTYDQAEISLTKKSAENMSCISVWDVHRPFRFKVVGIENVSPLSNSFMAAYSAASSSKLPSNCDEAPLYMYFTAELYHGGELLDKTWYSSIVPSSNNPRWCEWAKFNISIANLPRAVRVCFTAWVAKRPQRSEYSDNALAWVNFQLFDYKHELRTGPQNFKMWLDDKANPIGTCVSNDGDNPTSLYIELENYQLPVVFPTEPVAFPAYPVPTSMTNDEQKHVLRISAADPLYRLTRRDKHLMWKYREFCKSRPRALPKFLASVPKADARAVQEMYRLLNLWAPIAPIDALELLDSKFADAKVREYAVRRLEELSREDLLDYLLQMVQVLKYEPYHQTAFASFLLRAAFSNKAIGHHFFWYLKSEIHVPEISERFGLLLEAYLRGCGNHINVLSAQNDLQLQLVGIANKIKPLKDSERLQALRDALLKVPFTTNGVSIPLNPRIEVTGLKVEKCKYMDSKKLPLWLVFQNADPKGSDPYVIFKSGDDLRQDMLTLQMIRIMEHLWKKADLDFMLNAYGCIATGDEVGMIEVVLNSMTTAHITKSAGGATAAFREDPIDNWIRQNNPGESYRLAKDRFILSCAGYCVATYVLGIGDRHNDNIMLTKDGRLFHIDFGHFLGNFKKKFGVKRERAPFVFTPDFAYVMGGKDAPDFNRFIDLCGRAYNVLRKHANIFINLFAMMLSTGIPELRTTEDIQYLRDAFSLDLNEQQAAEKFKDLVYEAMSSRTTQINNAIHIWAH